MHALPPVECRIRGIEKSLACLTWGLLAWIPLLGFVCSIVAFFLFHSARQAIGNDWNPAARHLTWGGRSAVLALAANAALLLLGGFLLLRILYES